ncbi:MAG: hypothetical protein IPL61_34480 [Myxococcales bacterium]|nr:hypothetical protein [Myxococcales bacterium]
MLDRKKLQALSLQGGRSPDAAAQVALARARRRVYLAISMMARATTTTTTTASGGGLVVRAR